MSKGDIAKELFEGGCNCSQAVFCAFCEETGFDKETALKYFNANCNKYFELNTRFKTKTLPASYGYATRKFIGMSKPMFEKNYGKIAEQK